MNDDEELSSRNRATSLEWFKWLKLSDLNQLYRLNGWKVLPPSLIPSVHEYVYWTNLKAPQHMWWARLSPDHSQRVER